MGQLDGKTAIVTGGGTGIGRAVAVALAAEGTAVAVIGRRPEPLEDAVAAITAAGGKALALPADVTDEGQIASVFAQVGERLGPVDILVNNAGLNAPGPTAELALADWRRVIDVNLTGVFLCSREALRVMQPRHSGRIIMIGSVSAKVPREHAAAYTTSKFGLDGLTRSLALDARPHRIAVSIVHPGNTATAIWAGREDRAQTEGVMASEDVAKVVVTTATLPPEVNLLESIVLPVTMPFVGRG